MFLFLSLSVFALLPSEVGKASRALGSSKMCTQMVHREINGMMEESTVLGTHAWNRRVSPLNLNSAGLILMVNSLRALRAMKAQ